MSSARNSLQRVFSRWRAEPVVHFFLLGALLFAGRHVLVGDPRTIVVTPGLERELARRFEDQRGRKPDPEELATERRQWARDEALFREALRRRLDRDDPTVRTALVDKMHAMASAEVPERAPTDAELERWLAAHRDRYEAPLRYDFEYFEFAPGDGEARAELERIERAIREGANPTSLGRPVLGGKLTVADMRGRIAPALAARIPSLPPGQWQAVEADQTLLLARVKRIEGGLPSAAALRPTLIADWSAGTRQEAVERILQETVNRYRVEQRP
jgi:peptidyl-prolyl cis-trans isomerase C